MQQPASSTAMAPQPLSWDALPEELVPLIGARLRTMRCYVATRGVCRTWRAELPPLAPSPFLLLLTSKFGSASVHSLPMQRLFSVGRHNQGYRYLGSSDDGWLAVAYKSGGSSYGKNMISDEPMQKGGKHDTTRLPLTREKTETEEERSLCPKKEGAAMDFYYRNFDGEYIWMDPDEIPEIRNPERDKLRMSLLNPVTGKHIVLPKHVKLDPHDVIKVAFAPNPSVHDYTVVAAYRPGGLAYISTRDRRDWSFGEIAAPMADLVYRQDLNPHGGGGDRVYCLTQPGDVHVLRVPRGRAAKPVVESLLPELEPGHPFDPTDVFPHPHDRLSGLHTGVRNLAFVDGELYQVWRNSVVPVTVPDGEGCVTVPKDEVFVLRFLDPDVWPCWVEETDLRGHAVFVGPGSSAMAVRAESVPGVKGNCVYWVGKPGKGPAMVFDLETRQSTPCIAPSPATGRCQPICWLSLGKETIAA